ncbi:MAG: copper resistance protein CopC [Proteobacteria bacterium]|nr:copper resistance protein CopC [Pseudomonadota bacterium]
MKGMLPTIAAMLAILAGVARAHTHIRMSSPADNAVLTAPPAELVLHFSEVTRLTSLSIRKDDEKDASNLGPLPKSAAQVLDILLAPVSPGKYTVSWRAVGDDSHVMSGTLHFSVLAR